MNSVIRLERRHAKHLEASSTAEVLHRRVQPARPLVRPICGARPDGPPGKIPRSTNRYRRNKVSMRGALLRFPVSASRQTHRSTAGLQYRAAETIVAITVS